MKTLLISCLFICTFSFAQTETTVAPQENAQPKNELGLNLFSINDLTWSRYHTTGKLKYEEDYNFGSGIYYKHHFGKNAWRGSFSYYQKAISVHNYIDWWSYSSTGVKKTEQLTAGYQREFLSNKFTPYVFSDLLFRYTNYSGTESYRGDFTWCDNCPFTQETFEYGMTLGFGLKYKVTKNITLSCESSAQGFYSVSEYLQYPGNGKYKTTSHRLNPLSQLGFAIAF